MSKLKTKKPSRKEEKKKIIMVFGTFDGLHQGHINLLKQARALAKNPFLVVSIARDKNVKKIKGNLPLSSENERKSLLENCSLADKVVLSGKSEHLPHIVKEKPEIIALGYDQTNYILDLKKDLKELGVSVRIIRLKPYKPHIFKNSLLKGKVKSK